MPRAKALSWRKARLADSRAFFDWRNDAVSRRNSLSSARLSWDGHDAWFARKLADKRCALWVALDARGRRVGQARVDGGWVSITVAPSRRGEGWGVLMLRRLPGGSKVLRAVIKPDNAASTVAFIKAGFRFRRLARQSGVEVYELERRGGFRA